MADINKILNGEAAPSVRDKLNEVIDKVNAQAVVVPVGDAPVFDPAKAGGYLAGSIVSYRNEASLIEQFQTFAIYVSNSAIPVGVSPEDSTEWLYKGTEYIVQSGSTSTIYVRDIDGLRELQDMKTGESVIIEHEYAIYTFFSNIETGIKPYLTGVGSWVKRKDISLSNLVYIFDAETASNDIGLQIPVGGVILFYHNAGGFRWIDDEGATLHSIALIEPSIISRTGPGVTLGDLDIVALSNLFGGGGVTTEYKADSFTVTEGGTVTGTVSDVQIANDGTTLRVNEASGGLTVEFDFINVLSFNYFTFHLQYVGGAGHEWQLELYNFDTLAWDVKSLRIGDQDALTYVTVPVPQDAAYISGGQVRVRFNHLPNFITSHYLLVDYVGVISSLTLSEGGLTAEQEIELANAAAHIDGVVEEKHKTSQVYDGLSPLSTLIPQFVTTAEIDMSDIAVGEKKILVAEKDVNGDPIFAGGVGLLDVIANPGLSTLLAETNPNWVGDEITLTGNNLEGQLGENSQFFELDADFFLCKTHDNGTTTVNGSATWKRNRGTDSLSLSIPAHVTIIGQLETETGWNALAQFKQITAKSKQGSWFRRSTGGYLYMCLDNSNGWTRIGPTPPTTNLEITSTSHPILTGSLAAHDFSTNRFYVEGTNASDEPAEQGQEWWDTTNKYIYRRNMDGNWAKLN